MAPGFCVGLWLGVISDLKQCNHESYNISLSVKKKTGCPYCTLVSRVLHDKLTETNGMRQ